MISYLEPLPEGTTQDEALHLAGERTKEQERKFVVRKDGKKLFVVPLFEAGQEGYRHDAGYACVGVLMKESL